MPGFSSSLEMPVIGEYPGFIRGVRTLCQASATGQPGKVCRDWLPPLLVRALFFVDFGTIFINESVLKKKHSMKLIY
jgi:hypothetical protein